DKATARDTAQKLMDRQLNRRWTERDFIDMFAKLNAMVKDEKTGDLVTASKLDLFSLNKQEQEIFQNAIGFFKQYFTQKELIAGNITNSNKSFFNLYGAVALLMGDLSAEDNLAKKLSDLKYKNIKFSHAKGFTMVTLTDEYDKEMTLQAGRSGALYNSEDKDKAIDELAYKIDDLFKNTKTIKNEGKEEKLENPNFGDVLALFGSHLVKDMPALSESVDNSLKGMTGESNLKEKLEKFNKRTEIEKWKVTGITRTGFIKAFGGMLLQIVGYKHYSIHGFWRVSGTVVLSLFLLAAAVLFIASGLFPAFAATWPLVGFIHSLPIINIFAIDIGTALVSMALSLPKLIFGKTKSAQAKGKFVLTASIFSVYLGGFLGGSFVRGLANAVSKVVTAYAASAPFLNIAFPAVTVVLSIAVLLIIAVPTFKSIWDWVNNIDGLRKNLKESGLKTDKDIAKGMIYQAVGGILILGVVVGALGSGLAVILGASLIPMFLLLSGGSAFIALLAGFWLLIKGSRMGGKYTEKDFGKTMGARYEELLEVQKHKELVQGQNFDDVLDDLIQELDVKGQLSAKKKEKERLMGTEDENGKRTRDFSMLESADANKFLRHLFDDLARGKFKQLSLYSIPKRNIHAQTYIEDMRWDGIFILSAKSFDNGQSMFGYFARRSRNSWEETYNGKIIGKDSEVQKALEKVTNQQDKEAIKTFIDQLASPHEKDIVSIPNLTTEGGRQALGLIIFEVEEWFHRKVLDEGGAIEDIARQIYKVHRQFAVTNGDKQYVDALRFVMKQRYLTGDRDGSYAYGSLANAYAAIGRKIKAGENIIPEEEYFYNNYEKYKALVPTKLSTAVNYSLTGSVHLTDKGKLDRFDDINAISFKNGEEIAKFIKDLSVSSPRFKTLADELDGQGADAIEGILKKKEYAEILSGFFDGGIKKTHDNKFEAAVSFRGFLNVIGFSNPEFKALANELIAVYDIRNTLTMQEFARQAYDIIFMHQYEVSKLYTTKDFGISGVFDKVLKKLKAVRTAELCGVELSLYGKAENLNLIVGANKNAGIMPDYWTYTPNAFMDNLDAFTGYAPTHPESMFEETTLWMMGQTSNLTIINPILSTMGGELGDDGKPLIVEYFLYAKDDQEPWMEIVQIGNTYYEVDKRTGRMKMSSGTTAYGKVGGFIEAILSNLGMTDTAEDSGSLMSVQGAYFIGAQDRESSPEAVTTNANWRTWWRGVTPYGTTERYSFSPSLFVKNILTEFLLQSQGKKDQGYDLRLSTYILNYHYISSIFAAAFVTIVPMIMLFTNFAFLTPFVFAITVSFGFLMQSVNTGLLAVYLKETGSLGESFKKLGRAIYLGFPSFTAQITSFFSGVLSALNEKFSFLPSTKTLGKDNEDGYSKRKDYIKIDGKVLGVLGLFAVGITSILIVSMTLLTMGWSVVALVTVALALIAVNSIVLLTSKAFIAGASYYGIFVDENDEETTENVKAFYKVFVPFHSITSKAPFGIGFMLSAVQLIIFGSLAAVGLILGFILDAMLLKPFFDISIVQGILIRKWKGWEEEKHDFKPVQSTFERTLRTDDFTLRDFPAILEKIKAVSPKVYDAFVEKINPGEEGIDKWLDSKIWENQETRKQQNSKSRVKTKELIIKAYNSANKSANYAVNNVDLGIKFRSFMRFAASEGYDKILKFLAPDKVPGEKWYTSFLKPHKITSIISIFAFISTPLFAVFGVSWAYLPLVASVAVLLFYSPIYRYYIERRDKINEIRKLEAESKSNQKQANPENSLSGRNVVGKLNMVLTLPMLLLAASNTWGWEKPFWITVIAVSIIIRIAGMIMNKFYDNKIKKLAEKQKMADLSDNADKQAKKASPAKKAKPDNTGGKVNVIIWPLLAAIIALATHQVLWFIIPTVVALLFLIAKKIIISVTNITPEQKAAKAAEKAKQAEAKKLAKETADAEKLAAEQRAKQEKTDEEKAKLERQANEEQAKQAEDARLEREKQFAAEQQADKAKLEEANKAKEEAKQAELDRKAKEDIAKKDIAKENNFTLDKDALNMSVADIKKAIDRLSKIPKLDDAKIPEISGRVIKNIVEDSTWLKTVEKLLENRGIAVGLENILNPPLSIVALKELFDSINPFAKTVKGVGEMVSKWMGARMYGDRTSNVATGGMQAVVLGASASEDEIAQAQAMVSAMNAEGLYGAVIQRVNDRPSGWDSLKPTTVLNFKYNGVEYTAKVVFYRSDKDSFKKEPVIKAVVTVLDKDNNPQKLEKNVVDAIYAQSIKQLASDMKYDKVMQNNLSFAGSAIAGIGMIAYSDTLLNGTKVEGNLVIDEAQSGSLELTMKEAVQNKYFNEDMTLRNVNALLDEITVKALRAETGFQRAGVSGLYRTDRYLSEAVMST
ncbi:MAG: hypothetical protein FWC57_00875, partial [Endomicrobia bacterium]|nr:hypothetical protein [Endomicrobiia bacterium]